MFPPGSGGRESSIHLTSQYERFQSREDTKPIRPTGPMSASVHHEPPAKAEARLGQRAGPSLLPAFTSFASATATCTLGTGWNSRTRGGSCLESGAAYVATKPETALVLLDQAREQRQQCVDNAVPLHGLPSLRLRDRGSWHLL